MRRELETRLENSPSKEKDTEKGLVIVIVGNPGTGTSALAQELGGELGIPFGTLRTRGAGDKFRKDVKTPVIGYVERPVGVDRKLDRRTYRNIRKTRPGRTKIVEARLAAVMAFLGKERAEKFGDPFPDVFAILLYADENVRVERIFNRDAADLNLTKEDVRGFIRERQDKDLVRFRVAHPGLLDDFDPTNPDDPWCRKHYDLILDSSKLDIKQEVEAVKNCIYCKGYFIEKGVLFHVNSEEFKKRCS